MKSFKPMLLLVVVFAAGLCAGVVGDRYFVRQKVQEAATRSELLQLQVERELVTRLGLDQEQESRLRSILSSAQQQIRQVRADVRPKVRRVLSEAQQQVSELLTPEQRDRLKQLRAERIEQFRAGKGSFPLLERWRSRREEAP